MKKMMTTGMFVLMCGSLLIAACGGGGKPDNAPPSKPGGGSSTEVKRLTVPEEIQQLEPTKSLTDADFIAKGKELFESTAEASCVQCHGEGGKGDGILAASFAKTANPVPDLTTAEFHDAVSDHYIYWRIAEPEKSKADKSSGMLGYSNAGGDQEKLWAVVAYVRSLKGK